MMKRCSKCRVEKPLGEFYKDRRKKDGLQSQCKECVRKVNRAWREANREKIAERKRAYREANREKIAERKRAYREAHLEERRERAREYNRASYTLLGRSQSVITWQEVTAKHATRGKEPWTAAEDAYLTTSTERIGDDALNLKRTYAAVQGRIQHLREQCVTLARDVQKVAA